MIKPLSFRPYFFGFADVARREMALLHAISIFCEVYDDEVPAEQLLKDLQLVAYRVLHYRSIKLVDLIHIFWWFIIRNEKCLGGNLSEANVTIFIETKFLELSKIYKFGVFKPFYFYIH